MSLSTPWSRENRRYGQNAGHVRNPANERHNRLESILAVL